MNKSRYIETQIVKFLKEIEGGRLVKGARIRYINSPEGACVETVCGEVY